MQLAWMELYAIVASVSHQFDMELFEIDVTDVRSIVDGFRVHAKSDSKRVRFVINGVVKNRVRVDTGEAKCFVLALSKCT